MNSGITTIGVDELVIVGVYQYDTLGDLNVLRVNPDGTLVEVSLSPTILVLPDSTRPPGVVAF